MSDLFVGIDLGAKEFATCIMLANGEVPVKTFKLDQNLSGASSLVEKVLAVAAQHQITQLFVAMEATGMLGWHLVSYLRQHDQLTHLTPVVHCLNARQVAHFKKALAQESKTDPGDAYAIADRLRFRQPKHAYVPEEAYLALQRLTRLRFQMVRSLTREKNRFLSHLYLKFPGFCQEDPFSNTFGAASTALLTENLTVEEIAEQSIEALAIFLQEKGHNRFSDPVKMATVVQQAAKKSYRLSKVLADPVNVVLSMILENIRYFEKQIKQLDKVIARELDAMPGAVVLRSVPGIGPVFAAGILAEIQDIHRFASDDSLAKFAALVWKRDQSGDFEADETPMSHSGNAYLRYYLVEAANCVRMHNDEYGAYYKTKYQQASTHQHKRACVLTARKLVRLIHFLLSHGQLYQPPTVRKESPHTPNSDDMSPGEIARHAAHRRRTGAHKRAATAG